MRNKHPVDLINDKNFNKKSFLVRYIDDESDNNRNKEKKDDSKD